MSILIAGGHRRALAGFRFPPCTSATSTRAAQLALLDQLLYAWADTIQMAERLEARTTQYRFRCLAFGKVSLRRTANESCWLNETPTQGVCQVITKSPYRLSLLEVARFFYRRRKHCVAS